MLQTCSVGSKQISFEVGINHVYSRACSTSLQQGIVIFRRKKNGSKILSACSPNGHRNCTEYVLGCCLIVLVRSHASWHRTLRVEFLLAVACCGGAVSKNKVEQIKQLMFVVTTDVVVEICMLNMAPKAYWIQQFKRVPCLSEFGKGKGMNYGATKSMSCTILLQ